MTNGVGCEITVVTRDGWIEVENEAQLRRDLAHVLAMESQ